MIGEPWFWRERTIAARLASAALAPAALAYDAAQRFARAHARPFRAPVPVFCIGNATLGGVGKTPMTMLVAARLRELGVEAHLLSRGYGGKLAGPVRVEPDRHNTAEVGDEPLLLAAAAPTWVAKSRVAGLAAAAADAAAVVMDDGFQNPSIEKTLSILLIDAADPHGNGRIFPAGPMRESLASAIDRADLVVEIVATPPETAATSASCAKPTLRAWLEADTETSPARVFAFCGIARPERFFALLDRLGFDIAGRAAFPDHHGFTETELARLKREAARAGADLITTEKDLVRIDAASRDGVRALPVAMKVDDTRRLDALLADALARFASDKAQA